MSILTVDDKLLKALTELGIAWTLHEHGAVFTVEASAQIYEDIAGAHTKNLFLKDSGSQFWLVTVPHDARVDLKAMPAVIGSKKLSFGKAEDMERLLGISPGAVTPLAACNDVMGLVKVVIDARLADADCINVHPLRNTATLGLSGEALLLALKSWGHDPIIADVPAPQ